MSSLKDLASLIMVPSLYKDGELHTVKPLGNSILHPDATGNHDGTDGSTPAEGNFTFSRGSNLAATRVDVNGLIEKGRENLALYSNDFNNSYWITGAGTKPTCVQDQTDPFGNANNAWTITGAGTAYSRLMLPSQTISTTMQTLSFFVKKGTKSFVQIWTAQSSVASLSYNFDTQVLGGVDGVYNVIRKVDDIGNGWYRIAMSINRDSGTSSETWGLSFDGSSDSVIIYGAQQELGLVATDYIETGASTAQAGILEDMPRLDYSGSCPALLLEPQRTNLVPHSEYFGAWSPSTGVVVTDNFAESPEGLDNAAYIEFGSASKVVQLGTGLSTGVTCTASIWIKGTSGETIRIAAGGADSSNLTLDGTWQRFEHTATSLNSTFNINTYGGATARNIYVYGAQLEAGSYPTSYIPTYGSSVTRSKDLPYKTGLSNVIGQTQGTIFYDWIMNHESPNTSEDLYTLTLTDGSNSNLIAINNYNNTLVVIIKATTNQFIDNSYTGGADGARIKLALAYANNDVALYINGSLIATSSSVAVPALNEIRLNGYWNSVLNDNTSVNQLAVFQTRLTNAELAALTTL